MAGFAMALAAGAESGGYASLSEAASRMGTGPVRTYAPDKSRHAVYEPLYRDYLTLIDYFGRGGNDIMKRLLAQKKRAVRRRD